MKFHFEGADVVWSAAKDGPTKCHTTGTMEVDLPPLGSVRHYSIVYLKWNERRYEIVGGLLLAVGTPGVRDIGPLNPANKHEVKDAVWHLDAAAPERTEFTPSMLVKTSDSLQWHEGDTRKCDGTFKTDVASLRVEVGTDWLYRVWDVTETYRTISMQIVHTIEQRTNRTLFKRNTAHWGPAFDERGFIRQSEIRLSFPSIPTPGCCIEECAANRISPHTFTQLVEVAFAMCGVDRSVFERRFNHTSCAATVLRGSATDHNILEALSTAILSLSGVHVGYDAELIDDTCVPWQEGGTNSDCEDFAFAAVGLHHHIRTGLNLDHLPPFARFMALWIRAAYPEAYVATGFVTPAVARPDGGFVAEDALAGHGFVLLKRARRLQPDFAMRYVVVECTAVTVSYRPTVPPDPDMPLAKVCAMEFDGVLSLGGICNPDLPTSIGSASLIGLDSKGIPFKYKTVATLSTAVEGFVATTDGQTVGVDMKTLQDSARVILVPTASKEASALYDKHFRGFQLNPDNVCGAVPPKRQELTIPEGWRKNAVALGTPMHGVVAVTGSDLRRAGLDAPPPNTSHTVVETPLTDVVLIGVADASGGTLNDHHSTPIRGDLTKVRVHRRFMRQRGGEVNLQPRLARFYIGDTPI